MASIYIFVGYYSNSEIGLTDFELIDSIKIKDFNTSKISNIKNISHKIFYKTNPNLIFLNASVIIKEHLPEFIEIIVSEFNEICKLEENNWNIYFYCHDKELNNSIPGDRFDYVYSDAQVNKYKLSEKCHFKLIVEFQHEHKGIVFSEILINLNSIKQEQLDSINEKFVKNKVNTNIIELKKKLIDHWLPLAIDIQGLSELKDDERKAKEYYYNEIRKELISDGKETAYFTQLKSFPQDMDFPRWKEIENELTNGYKNFKPSKLAEFIYDNDFTKFKKDSEKSKINYLAKIELDSQGNEILDEKNKPKENPNFLPNWLQKVVEALDEKINPKKPSS